MSNKENYCYQIMRKYGLLVKFDGEPSMTNVPDPLRDGEETMTQWVMRVLGSHVENVVVYTPRALDGRHKVVRIQDKVDSLHLRKVSQVISEATDGNAEGKSLMAPELVETRQTNPDKSLSPSTRLIGVMPT